ncbi:MAG TPA: hypothetical protein VH062_29850 [Polyangiaceae bacterium]|nr:hypothetical protein [Polyangiaceae bacterium]
MRARALLIPAFLAAGCTSILNIDGHYVAGTTTASGGETTSRPDADSGMDAEVASGGTGPGGAGGAPETGGTAAGQGGSTTGAGGTTGMGGEVETGGAVESGGAPGAGGVRDCAVAGNECVKGQKCCGSQAVQGSTCYAPSPLVGCGDTGCDYCSDPVPNNSTPSCKGGACSFACDPGYVEQSGGCVAMTTGTGGVTGTGGASTSTGGAPAVTTCDLDKDCSISCGPAGPFPCCMPNSMCGCTFFNLKLGSLPPIGYCLPRPPQFH